MWGGGQIKYYNFYHVFITPSYILNDYLTLIFHSFPHISQMPTNRKTKFTYNPPKYLQ